MQDQERAPGEGPRGEEAARGDDFSKGREQKDDGRYIIFYDFGQGENG